MVRLLILCFSFLFCTNALAAECGLFRVVKGKVTYKQKDKKKFRKARINKKVCQGDTVKTAADSRAKIVMADKNELNLSPKTELIIEIYKNNAGGKGKALLNVVYGKIRSNVKQKYKGNKRSHYRVKTKSAVAGVRGTEFMTSYNQFTNESRIVTFEGEVAVGEIRGGQMVSQVTVKPGQFTSNSPGTKPHPAKEVPPQELAQMDRETNVDSSPRDVAADPKGDKPAAEKEEPKKDQPDNKKPEPKADPSKDQPQGDDAKSGNAAGGSADGNKNAAGGPGAPAVEGGERDIASVEGGDPLGLPPPTLDDLPDGDGLGFVEPPKIPSFDPIIETVPQCLTCNDAVINQKVNLTIIPVLPGGTAQ